MYIVVVARKKWSHLVYSFFFFLFLLLYCICKNGRKDHLDHFGSWMWDYTSDERLTNIRLWINLEISRIKLSLINPNFYSSLTHKRSLFPPFFYHNLHPVFRAFSYLNLYAMERAKIELWTGHNNHFHFLILIIHLKNNWDRRVWKIAFESI